MLEPLYYGLGDTICPENHSSCAFRHVAGPVANNDGVVVEYHTPELAQVSVHTRGVTR